ncbi:response regulator [Brevibacillus brevis]|uniref:Probable two-component response regulator n=1 Tax=Brevibacillus brevis (strain 47 / JCM 6285 / NBRC 100599) TaxID=358681 RepID=C0ZK80_BREBN|nr:MULTISPECIES: response regulator [Bacillales]NRR04420.1 response regulator [Brevibacillus sp. RS1.1]NRS51725.1 response regulator [Brevibacillus sp. HB2.2]TQR31128.1 response regulator [Lysinibacillus sp. SDF0063]UIO43096.1 response regulator [Brevibacillus brevis]WGV60710.1 response regulator [Brevibacillus brevis]
MNTILIVDDTAFTRLVLRNMFEKLGIEVVAEADSGEEAVRNYCLYRPSLVIMDITMPGMNGLVASRKIIELDKNAKIIICSAVARRDTVIKAIQAGARDFIAKPLQFERIEWAVQHLLETDSR